MVGCLTPLPIEKGYVLFKYVYTCQYWFEHAIAIFVTQYEMRIIMVEFEISLFSGVLNKGGCHSRWLLVYYFCTK